MKLTLDLGVHHPPSHSHSHSQHPPPPAARSILAILLNFYFHQVGLKSTVLKPDVHLSLFLVSNMRVAHYIPYTTIPYKALPFSSALQFKAWNPSPSIP